MRNYLKKKKMHKLAKNFYDKVPALSECSYKFFNGSEWLRFSSPVLDEEDIYFNLYVCSSFLHFEKLSYDPYANSSHTISCSYLAGQSFRDLIASL